MNIMAKVRILEFHGRLENMATLRQHYDKRTTALN